MKNFFDLGSRYIHNTIRADNWHLGIILLLPIDDASNFFLIFSKQTTVFKMSTTGWQETE